ncbi:hypothetical protein MPSI1_002471 [Malassezia psittaci]|uniref:Uncharacterized protein n=1 Tax=Malassezia psittaci TaxID=1821823 RepID=A0AAF0F668_9BASI|nr:hypothetical protein MPSI1_002471 [Malassezia psittaci]
MVTVEAPQQKGHITHNADFDEAQVIAFGHTPVLERNFSFISMLGLAFAILNSWTALSVSISLALPSGGPSSVIWGLVTAGICNVCLAMSLSEFLSAFPTAGGQYHWVAFVSPPKYRRILSWITGWINVGGWLALSASGGLLGSQLVVGLASLMHPNYEAQRWHQFLIYIAYSMIGFLTNAFATFILPLANKTSFCWSITGFAVICIVVLATASPDYASGKWVFGDFLNETGWPDGIAWLLGLLQGSFGLTAYDAVAHMIEEIPDAAVQGPRIMNASVWVGIGTGFIFLMVMLFVSGGEKNVTELIETTQTPLIHIFKIATKSNAGSICLTLFPLVCLVFANIGFFTASSRMTFAFARERGLPFSPFFSHVHSRLKLPLNALFLTLAVVVIFGCIFLGSTSAFNAIVSASVIALNLTYGIPVLINCLQGRKKLPPRAYTLSPFVGWLVNIVGILYVILTTVLFFFPPEIPATGSSMNYAIAAFVIWLSICTIYWFVKGHKDYDGPALQEFLQNMGIPITDDILEGADRSEFNVDRNKDGEAEKPVETA